MGGSGDAGRGARLFGSEGLFAVLCLPFFAVPALGLYLGAACVVRDVARGPSRAARRPRQSSEPRKRLTLAVLLRLR